MFFQQKQSNRNNRLIYYNRKLSFESYPHIYLILSIISVVYTIGVICVITRLVCEYNVVTS
jgi:hypothetical protein